MEPRPLIWEEIIGSLWIEGKVGGELLAEILLVLDELLVVAT